ncbi:putative ribonuclease H-like domain-containing protein [Tanacetum coccineum]|uniref:Ribonuclease H-like domain-containing protein n=1 Tax=Tanacetum coccineum TaxID=301880 RepID=A0ABQ5BN89_9ASTR
MLMYKVSKTLFAAIQTRFGGNEATKKTQKTLLKQMYKNFSALSTESLDSIFNRHQKIISQAILDENISQEDLNLKFLRSMPSEWNTHVVVWRNKPNLETMSFDDLYNNFKIVEQEVKGTTSSSSSSFSTANTQVSPASTQVSTASTQVSTANLSDDTVYAFLASQPNGSQLVYEDLEQIHEDDIEEMDLKWQLALLSMRTRRFFQKTGRKITINGSDTAGYDKSKVECFNCHKMRHFAMECRGHRNQDSRNRNQDGSRRTVNVEETSSKAMVAIDGAGFDWSYMINDEVPTNMALIAFSDSKVHNDKTCSKTCLKRFETLKTQLDDLRIEFNKSVFNLASYKRGLAFVEEQLVFYKKNEVIFYEQLAVLKRDISYKDSEISMLKKEFQQPEFKGYGPKTSKSVSEDISNEVRESPDALLVKELVSNDKLEKKTVFPTVVKIEFVRPKQQEKPVRKPVKYAEMYRSQSPKGNQRNWNNQKERVVSGNNYTRMNYNYSAKKAHHSAHRNMVPRTVLMKTGLRSLNNARTVNTAHPKTTVYSARPMSHFSKSAQSTGHPQKEDQGYVDSGCSSHMTGNMSYLLDFKEFDGGYVTFGGGAKGGKIIGKGTLKTADESQVLLKVHRKNNIYSVDMKNFVPKESLTYLVAKATLDESMLWHRRLGHGKQHKASCKSKIQNSITQPLFMLHMDLFGLTFVSSLLNKKYYLVVTDDYSRFTWVFFLASKDETSGILKSFITEIENLVDKKVKIIICDNGTEFKNRVMGEFCKQKGIKREFSVARTPQQNGDAERRNRTIIEAARTMLADSKLPTIFWAKAVNTACYVQNRVLVVKTHNRPLMYCKFDGKSDEGFFVGYLMNSKAFRVYNIRTRKVEENLHIRFLEDKPIIAGDGPKWLFNIDVLTKLMNYVPVVPGTNSNDFADGSLFDSSSKNASNDKPQPSIDARKKDDEGVNKESGIHDQERPKNSTQDVNVARPKRPENSTQNVNTAGPSINTASTNVNTGNATLEDTHADSFGNETEVDMRNISTTYLVPTTPNTRIYKDH